MAFWIPDHFDNDGDDCIGDGEFIGYQDNSVENGMHWEKYACVCDNCDHVFYAPDAKD